MNSLKSVGLCILMVVAGCLLVDTFQEPEPDEYITREVRQGDTLYEIAEEYYDLNKPGKMCFDEYFSRVRETNYKLQNSNRVLQIGDEVKVPVYKK